MKIRLPNNWNPRRYQLPAWRAWERGIKRELLVWHRRAGKDDYALHKSAVAMHPDPVRPHPGQRIGNYWHCLPEYAQAKKAIWEAVNPHSGKRRIDEAFPPEIRARTDNSAMTIETKSGCIWRVVGSDNPDSLVGAPPVGITFSEWALSNPAAWAYLAPILAENGGWASFITTPRGRNHAKTMLDMARRNRDRWFSEVLTIDDTGAISMETVEEQRQEYTAIFGPDAADVLIDQEYWCSFEAAILGAYYGREMMDMERDGRITEVPWDPNLPVHTAWDIDLHTAIWFFQSPPGGVNVIDYFESTDKSVEWICEEVLDKKPYEYGTDYVPHDARTRVWTNRGPDGKAKSRVQTLIDLKRKPQIIVSHRVEDGINTVKQLLPVCAIDAVNCEQGIECLRQYRREWDQERRVFQKTPYKDWTNHGADAYRYLAMAVRAEKLPERPKPPDNRGLHVGANQVTLDEFIRMNAAEGDGRI